MSEDNHFTKRDVLIRDRLYRMKAAALDILNMIDFELPDGGIDCDGTCSSCILEELSIPNTGSEQSAIGCTDIVKISEMIVPESSKDAARACNKLSLGDVPEVEG